MNKRHLIILIFLAVIKLTYANQEKFVNNDQFSQSKSNFKAIPKEFIKEKPSFVDYFIINLKGPIQKNWIDALINKSFKPLLYFPDNSYIIKMKSSEISALKEFSFIDKIIPYQPYFKLSDELKEIIYSNEQADSTENVFLRITIFKDEDLSSINAYIGGYFSASIISEVKSEQDSRVVLKISGAFLKEFVKRISFLSEVEGIEVYHEILYNNDAARWVHQDFIPEFYPLYENNLYGQGQIGAISDSGFDYDMCFFYDPIYKRPPVDIKEPWGDIKPNYDARKVILYYAMDANECGEEGSPGADYVDNDHGTHTACSFAGNNYEQNCTSGSGIFGDGIALCSKLILQDLGPTLNFINNGCGTIYDLLLLSYKDGARVSTNSWGYGCYGCPCAGNFYNPDARDVDRFIWEHKDMAVFFSAGNSASSCPDSTVCSPGTAKNCITVGSSQHDLQAVNILQSSSRGWTYDMRLKPDLIAQGKDVISANNDGDIHSYNCSVIEMSGTSMACPVAAGYGILTRQYYYDGYYPTGSPNPSNGFNPSAALLKATMINSAVDMTGVPSSPPNIIEGWGRLKLNESLFFPADSKKLIVFDENEGLATGWAKCYYIDNYESNNSLKITLAWSDYPAALYANPALVNDLMLEVTDPSGTNTYHQTLDPYFNIIQTNNPSLPQDNRNNVEQLTIDFPTNGIWKIKVKGINIPFPLQPYAIVATGSINMIEQPAPPVNINATADSDNQITVSWNNISSAQCYNIYRSFGSCTNNQFDKIADCIPVNYFIDKTVSGGSTYSYKITAIYDNACESAFSQCVEATAKGICTLPPSFSGNKTIINNKTSPCSVSIQWEPAESNCPAFPNISYNIYKSTNRNFNPSQDNLIASCLKEPSFTDYDVASCMTFYYIIRAEDSRPGGGTGACNSGNTDSNKSYLKISPTGNETILYFDDAGDSTNPQMTLGENWSITNKRNNTPYGTYSYYSGTSLNNQCSSITSPPILLKGGSFFFLEFFTYYNIEEAWDAGIVEISTDNGASWAKLIPIQGYPSYTINTDSCIGKYTSAFTGNNNAWTYYSVDLTPYSQKTINIRFRFGSDSYVNYENWYIDDIKITALSSCLNGSPNCSTPPLFDGLATAMSTENTTCSNYLYWKHAKSTCLLYPYVKYHIYRSTDPYFSPSPYNKITSCLNDNYFIDDNVSEFTDYYYIVRAEDSSTNGNGPCNFGNSDSNTVIKSANPSTHTFLFDNFENGLSNWTISGNWTLYNKRSHSLFHSISSGNEPNQCDTLTLNKNFIPPQNGNPSISFWTIYSTENHKDAGIIESSTDNINWTRIELQPPYPSSTQNSSSCISNNTPCFSGTNSNWTHYSSLEIPYIPNQPLYLRFLYASDEVNNQGGWLIDDVSIKYNLSCQTAPHPPGTVPDNDNFPGPPLKIQKLSSNALLLTWSPPLGACLSQNYDYAVYQGSLPFTKYDYIPITCSTNGNLSYTINSDQQSYYYIVVAVSNSNEGSYGLSFPDSQRPPSLYACYNQSIGSCN